MWADSLATSLDTVAVYDGFQSPFGSYFLLLQLGPDGRIYGNCPNSENVMHAIQYPDRKGDACQVRQHSVQLPTYNAFTMPHFPNYRLGPLDGNPCDTLGLDNLPLAKFRYEADTIQTLLVEFTDNSFYEPEEWLWDFDDTHTSNEKDPIHLFEEPGIYTVCLTVSNAYGEDTFCREVELSVNSAGEKEGDSAFLVYPNPATDYLTVQNSEGVFPNTELIIYDAVGNLVKSEKIMSGGFSHTVSLSELPAGMYFYQISVNRAIQKTGKMVVGQ